MEEMTAREVAAFLRVARSTLYGLIRSHGLPKPVKVGGSSRWYRHEVMAWRQARDEAR